MKGSRRVGTAFAGIVGIAAVQGVGAACTGDAVDGFTCDPQGNVAIGAVFASDSGTRRNVALALVEDLLEEEVEETGGGAGDGLPVDVYATALYADKSFDAGRVPGLDADSLGLVIGATLRGSHYFVGAALDYANEDADLDGDAGGSETDEIGVQLYGTLYPMGGRNLFVSAAFRYAWADIDTERTFFTDPTSVNAGVLNTARGSTDGESYEVLGGLGYNWALGESTIATLSGWLSWKDNTTDAYTESGTVVQGLGGATANLFFEEDSYSTLDGIVTLDLTHQVPISNGRLLPSLSVSYVHEFESDTRTIDARLADIDPPDPNSSVIRFTTNAADESYFRLGASLTAQYRQGTRLYASYNGTFAHEWRNEHLFSIGIAQSF